MPENENNPVRSSLGGLSDKASEKSEGNCPACNDNPMGTPLPHNPNVLVAPYTPPTAQELELTRNFYAGMEARANEGTGATPVRRVLGNIEDRSADEQFTLKPTTSAQRTVQSPESAFPRAFRDGVRLPDTSIREVAPDSQIAPSLQLSIGRVESRPDTAISTALGRAMSGEDVLLGSQFTEPWFDPGNGGIGPFLLSGTPGEEWEVEDPRIEPKDDAKENELELEHDEMLNLWVVRGKRLLGVPKVDEDGKRRHRNYPPPEKVKCVPEGYADCDPAKIIQTDFWQTSLAEAAKKATWSKTIKDVSWSGTLDEIETITIYQTATVMIDIVRCQMSVQKCCCDDDCVVYVWGLECWETREERELRRKMVISRKSALLKTAKVPAL